jgi:hypothetical protein
VTAAFPKDNEAAAAAEAEAAVASITPLLAAQHSPPLPWRSEEARAADWPSPRRKSSCKCATATGPSHSGTRSVASSHTISKCKVQALCLSEEALAAVASICSFHLRTFGNC